MQEIAGVMRRYVVQINDALNYQSKHVRWPEGDALVGTCREQKGKQHVEDLNSDGKIVLSELSGKV